jgi:hypothetical protein
MSVRTATTADALGRVTYVLEDVTGMDLATSYQYDVLGGLTNVQKCPSGGCANGSSGQVRTFQYDSLGRMTQATNPESGTVTYGVFAVSQVRPHPALAGVRQFTVQNLHWRVIGAGHLGVALPEAGFRQ